MANPTVERLRRLLEAGLDSFIAPLTKEEIIEAAKTATALREQALPVGSEIYGATLIRRELCEPEILPTGDVHVGTETWQLPQPLERISITISLPKD